MSCSNNTRHINDQLEYYSTDASIVEEWQGRTIEFPSVMVDVATGDTIDTSEADFILLTYIDSAGCTGCSMKLPLWIKFIVGQIV